MDDKQIQDLANRLVESLNGLKPLVPDEKEWWEHLAAFGSWAALLAAGLAFWIGWKSLQHQRTALKSQNDANKDALDQKREADARSEWWRRTQWALEAAASDNPSMYGYGAGMLDLLAQSELASPKDKALLDAVWEGTSTEMQPEGIARLIDDARNQENLSYEEMASLLSYDESAAGSVENQQGEVKNLSYEELSAMFVGHVAASGVERKGRPHESPDQTGNVDDSTASGDNESSGRREGRDE